MTKLVALIPGNPSFIVTLVSVLSTITFAKKLMDKELSKKSVKSGEQNE